MPYLNGNAQTNRTGQLPPTPQPRTTQAPAQTPQQTQATGQTPAPAQTTAQTPSTAPTQTTPGQSVAQPPKDQAQIQNQQGTSATSISLLEDAPPPEPPALLKADDQSATVRELNKLLRSLGLTRQNTDVYNSKTTEAIREFQRDNNLTVTGKVDEKTLRKLLDAAKEDDNVYRKLEAAIPKPVPLPVPRPANLTPPAKPPAKPPAQPAKPATTPAQTPSSSSTPATSTPGTTPSVNPTATTPDTPPVTTPAGTQPTTSTEPTAPVAPKVYANDFERVQDMVATQLSEKGIDSEKAFGIGKELTGAAQTWDRRMPSSTMCYTAVKRAIDDAINIPYKVYGGRNGGSAKTAGTNMLSKSPEFVQIQGLTRGDLDNLPAGAVIVYKPAKGHGHIGVQDGKGQDISDKTRTQSNVHRSAAFEVWYPVSVRGKD